MSDEDIARMLTESFTTAEQDMRERSLRESRVEAERLLLATRAALRGRRRCASRVATSAPSTPC